MINYTCRFCCVIDFIWIFFLLSRLEVPPKITPFSFGEDPMNNGELIMVSCAITGGDLPVEIEWLFNGKPMNFNRNGVNIKKLGERVLTLMIESVSATHIGNYTCRISNKAGISEHNESLYVNGSKI